MKGSRIAAAAGAALGVAAAILLISSWRVGSAPAVDARIAVTLAAAPSPSFDVSREPITTGDVTPGSVREGRLEVRNQTSLAQTIALRAQTDVADADASVSIKVSAPAGAVLFEGTLGELAGVGTGPLTLRGGESTTLTIAASLRRGATQGLGTSVNVTLQPVQLWPRG